MVNRREREVLQKYQNQGWSVLRGGAPDFLFLRTNDGKIVDQKFVEVKSRKSDLTYEQKIWRDVLEELGAKYKVEIVE